MTTSQNSPQMAVKIVDGNGNILGKTDTPFVTVPSAETSVVKTADAQIKATAGTVSYVQATFVGATIGDTVEIENKASAGGTALITLTAAAANENVKFNPPVGTTFSIGIWAEVTLTGGAVTITIVYS